MKVDRTLRVAKEIQKSLNEIVMSINNQTLNAMIVTHIGVSKDLSLAKVFYSSLDDVNKLESELPKHTKNIQSKLFKSLKMKKIPILNFIQDDPNNSTNNIETLLMRAKLLENKEENTSENNNE